MICAFGRAAALLDFVAHVVAHFIDADFERTAALQDGPRYLQSPIPLKGTVLQSAQAERVANENLTFAVFPR